MKKALIIISIVACLFSCGTTGTSSTTGNNSSTNPSFYERNILDFSKDDLSKLYVSDGYCNGTPFGCTWSKSCVEVENDTLKMTIKEAGDVKHYTDPIISGAIGYRGSANEDYMKGFGYYSCVMKPVKGNGIISAFFTYSNEGNNHNEIDIEFLGKNTKRVQFNYYVDNEPNKGHEHMHNLSFDYTKDYHKYGFLWTSEKIVWYIDDKPVYEVNGSVPQAKQEIMSNLWTIDSKNEGGVGWAGAFDTSTIPLSMHVKSISYVSLDEIEQSQYYHYDAVPATLNENGCKEYWVNKKSGEVTLIEPTGDFVKIEEKPSPTPEEINSWDEDDARIELKYAFDGNKLRFGSYPQSQVRDNALKAILKHEAGSKAPTIDNPGKWKPLNHYSAGRKTTKMFYQDVFDSTTKSKYRGIYLLENRPLDPISDLNGLEAESLFKQSTQYRNGYSTGKFYWFKFEPIIWDINCTNSNIFVLTSNTILDAFEFDYNINSSYATPDESKGDNTYQDSTLREFLNSSFKDTAFNQTQLNVCNDYLISDEKDKVSINSEANNLGYYQTMESRKKSPSSYALAMGVYSSTNDIYGNSYYWTRSPYSSSYKAMVMTPNGITTNRDVWSVNTGVAPCININLGGLVNA